MTRQEKLSVLITFVVGFVAGVYLYVTGFAAFLTELTVPDAEEVQGELTIVGDVYGGCRDTCPSFQVLDDGTYRYLYTPAAGADQIVRKGTLSRSQMNDLRSALVDSQLVRQSQKTQPGVCNSYTDGIDVRYEVTLDGNVYVLDSCGTDVDGEGSLWKTLGKIWDSLERGGNN